MRQLETGDLEKFIDEFFQPLRLFQSDAGIFCTQFRRDIRLILHEGKVADHAGQRRFQVVCQIDDQIIFALFRLFCGKCILIGRFPQPVQIVLDSFYRSRKGDGPFGFLLHLFCRLYNFPQVGEKDMYLLHHEEIESLALNMPGIKRIRFFMTFGQSYLTHLKCLENVGMTSIEPIMYEGKEIVPLQFLKAVLPDPASLGPRTVGKTNIGCIFQGKKDGKEKKYYLYNICDHQECYKEVGSQAISYTTGVPAMIGTMMVVEGLWKKPGVFNVEEFDPDPYMEALNKWGLPWVVCENPQEVE